MKTFLLLTTLAVSLFLASGCNSDTGLPVRGTVTLDGQPVATGLINFRPAVGVDARSSGATIRDGAYAIPSAKGLPPGKYLVSIQAYRDTGRMITDPLGQLKPEIVRVAIAEEFPIETNVAAGEDNTFDFQLTGVK